MERPQADKRPKLLGKQRELIYRLMREHCSTETINGTDYAVYEKDWSDARVAAEAQAINPLPERPIASSAVAKMRADVYGKVRDYRPPRPANGLLHDDSRLKELELQVGQLRDLVHRLTEWSGDIDTWVRQRGYRPPPGRPQSSPPIE